MVCPLQITEADTAAVAEAKFVTIAEHTRPPRGDAYLFCRAFPDCSNTHGILAASQDGAGNLERSESAGHSKLQWDKLAALPSARPELEIHSLEWVSADRLKRWHFNLPGDGTYPG